MAEKNAKTEGLYLALLSLHGLVRGHDMELGRDADTGGQVKYVVELAGALARHEKVRRVDLFTRLVDDKKVSDDYKEHVEPLNDRAHIIRIPFGPRRYLRKEVLWPYMDECVAGLLHYFRRLGRLPDVVHGHYADAGLTGARLAMLLGVPFCFTGHSLGINKLERLMNRGMSAEKIDVRYHIEQRIQAEEEALQSAALVVCSTTQEAEEQYARYDHFRSRRAIVIAPGLDLRAFTDVHPSPVWQDICRFWEKPKKPVIMAMSRADSRKNIGTLVDAYGQSKNLQHKANLLIVAGNRERIRQMDKETRRVLTDMLLRIDAHDLYGRVAYPKHHQAEDVPYIYHMVAHTKGVFVNPALTEPFGLTLIEAGASGLPVVATNDGGPRDIIANCQHGVLIDPLDTAAMAQAILGMLENRAQWRRYAKRGKRNTRKHYTWESHVNRYMRHIQRLVFRRRPILSARKRKSPLPTIDRLIVSDIDNTLLGDKESLDRLLNMLRECSLRVGFAIATGRRLESAIYILKKWGVPNPDIMITAVGTEIYYGSRYIMDRGWAKHISKNWQPDSIRAILDHLPGLVPQPQSEQRRFKVSYYLDPDKAPPLREIRKALVQAGVKSRVIFSHQQFLDILPFGASKGTALKYITQKWHLVPVYILVAGDSGNDRQMLTGEHRAVIVGNYSRELASLKGKGQIYFAQGHYAAGIIEGINHFQFLRNDYMADGTEAR